jgi:HNH endonuclease
MEVHIPENRCIYCLTTKGDFGSEEHIIPESLGNKEFILPRGYGCKKPCNNEILSWLDQQLCENIFMGFLKVWHGIPNKQGNPPYLSAQNLTATWIPGVGPHVAAKPNQKIILNRRILEAGCEAFSLRVRGRFQPLIIARALYKIALGMVAFNHGHEEACGSRYDAARAFIRKGQDFPNHLLLRTESRDEVMPKGEMRLEIRPTATPFGITLLGLTALMNLEPFPVMQLHEALAYVGFKSYPLYRSRRRGS